MNADTWELIVALDNEGASPHFLRVLMWDEDDRRNSIRQLVNKLDDLTEQEIINYSGGFATELWKGNLGEAFLRADGDNTYILTDLYDRWEIALYLDDDPKNYKHDGFLHPSWTNRAGEITIHDKEGNPL